MFRHAGSVQMLALLILVAALALVRPPTAVAQGPRISGSEAVRLSQCRVKTIDEAILAAERSGVLERMLATEGDVVQAEQVVAHLRDDVLKSAFAIADKQAENDIEIRYAKKASELASVEYLRALQANKEVANAFPEIEIRRLRLAAEKALLQVEQAEHQQTIAQLQRDETAVQLLTYRISAPFDGVVTKVHKRHGEAVREGEPILEIASTRRMRVEGFLEVKDSYRVARGAYVEVQLDIPGVELEVERLTFPGRVEFVDMKVQPVTQKVRVWADVANIDGALKDGLGAAMVIDPSRRGPDMLAHPQTAPIRR